MLQVSLNSNRRALMPRNVRHIFLGTPLVLKIATSAVKNHMLI